MEYQKDFWMPLVVLNKQVAFKIIFNHKTTSYNLYQTQLDLENL